MCDVFTLGAKITLGVAVSISENSTDVSAVPKIVNLTLSWSLLNSNVGKVDVEILMVLDNAFIPIVIGKLNDELSKSNFSFPKQFQQLSLSDFTQFEFVPGNGNGNPGFMCTEFDVALNS